MSTGQPMREAPFRVSEYYSTLHVVRQLIIDIMRFRSAMGHRSAKPRARQPGQPAYAASIRGCDRCSTVGFFTVLHDFYIDTFQAEFGILGGE